MSIRFVTEGHNTWFPKGIHPRREPTTRQGGHYQPFSIGKGFSDVLTFKTLVYCILHIVVNHYYESTNMNLLLGQEVNLLAGQEVEFLSGDRVFFLSVLP